MSTFHFDGYDITVDEAGVSSITVPADPSVPEKACASGVLQKIKEWWDNAEIRPYFNVVNMNDPTGELADDSEKPKPSVVIGVTVDF